MSTFRYKDYDYQVDAQGFLINSQHWDTNFAEGMAADNGIGDGLTKEHWDIINFIRNTFKETGKCPLIYQTCRFNGLHLRELKDLFPSGYLRGACKLAGVTYKEGYLNYSWSPTTYDDFDSAYSTKTYRVEIRGFLANPTEWDEQFASFKAQDMKIPGGLSDKHWQIIHFLRNYYFKNNRVATVYETCEANNIEIEELERLFPDGYHRGAVKIAGLRVR